MAVRSEVLSFEANGRPTSVQTHVVSFDTSTF